MDPGLVRALHDAFREALYDPQHTAILERFDMPVMHKGPEDYAEFVRRQYEEDAAMIRRLGLKL
jgi:tripartite-type tricarboxylate transporter receptor subunit TctC